MRASRPSPAAAGGASTRPGFAASSSRGTGRRGYPGTGSSTQSTHSTGLSHRSRSSTSRRAASATAIARRSAAQLAAGTSGLRPVGWHPDERRWMERFRPAAGLRPASWSGTGPWPSARLPGPAPCAAMGISFGESVRTWGPPGCKGSSLRASLYLFSSPCRSPPGGSVLFPAPIPRGALDRRSRAGVPPALPWGR